MINHILNYIEKPSIWVNFPTTEACSPGSPGIIPIKGPFLRREGK